MSKGSSRRLASRLSVAAMALALVAGLTVACTPTTSGSGSNSTAQFCSFYDKAQTTPPTDGTTALVKDQVVATADAATVTGSSCTDAAAKVDLDGATLAQGQEVASQTGAGASTDKVAAVTGDEISAGQPVLENLWVNSLSASIGANGITLRGNVNVKMSGVVSTIGFVGTLANLDNWSITLSSTSLTIPGITVSPVTFSGTLKSVNGVPSLSLTAAASSVKIGDVAVTGASLSLNASPATGVSVNVSGTLKVGPNTASGTVAVKFDKAGALVSAHAEIAATLSGNMAGGKKIDLTGTVVLDGNGTQTKASFKASGVLGDMIVNQANGDLTLATNKATFVGVLDIQQGANSVRFDGSIVWDGVQAYTPFLTVQGSGDISGTLNDGSQFSVSGTLDTTVVGGQVHASIDGAIKIGSLQANGSVILDVNGATTTLTVDANLVNAGFTAEIQGVVQITDGRAELVNLDAAVTGSLNFGDVTLNGATLHIGSTYGNPLDISFNGAIQIGSKADLSGTVSASFGPNGGLLSMQGQINGSLQLDSWGLLNFSGNIVASSQQVAVTGSGALTTINFPLGVVFNGTLVSSLTQPTWSLNGSGKLQIGSFTIATARLSLSQTAGMKATKAGFYFSIIGIPTYFEGDFYMKPGGGCDHVNITNGSFLAKPILALALPPIIGCSVNI